MFGLTYVPDGTDAVERFEAQQRYLHLVLCSKILTQVGRTILQEFAGTSDAQAILQALEDYYHPCEHTDPSLSMLTVDRQSTLHGTPEVNLHETGVSVHTEQRELHATRSIPDCLFPIDEMPPPFSTNELPPPFTPTMLPVSHGDNGHDDKLLLVPKMDTPRIALGLPAKLLYPGTISQ